MTIGQKILKVFLITLSIVGVFSTMFSVVTTPLLMLLALPSAFCFVGGSLIGSEFPE